MRRRSLIQNLVAWICFKGSRLSAQPSVFPGKHDLIGMIKRFVHCAPSGMLVSKHHVVARPFEVDVIARTHAVAGHSPAPTTYVTGKTLNGLSFRNAHFL